MILGSGSRHLGAVLALTLSVSAAANAQTALTTPVSEPGRTLPPCESTTFETATPIPVPHGATVPQQGVVVRVSLEYEDLKAAPAVTVMFNSGDQAFADAVVANAKELRFECARTGDAPVRFYREVQFIAGDVPRAVLGALRPPDDEGRIARNTGCFRSADGSPRAEGGSPLSSFSIGSVVSRSESEVNPGIVLAAMTFRGPDVPPETKILFRRGSERLETSVLDYVREHRWSCMKAGDPPVNTVQSFVYVTDKLPEPNKPTLQQLLTAIDGIAEQKVRFDFTTMACPFSFRLTYWRPFTSNEVVEVGGADPNRREFTLWLRRVTVQPVLDPGNKLVGRELEVSVPCVVLDLL